jgi:asparagine synthetase B (glutamine-hydrolysing)
MEATLNLMQCSEKTIPVHHNAAWPHGVEVEIPFADPQLWLFGTQLPLHLKSGEAGYPAKFLLRKAFDELLPKQILNRESTGFPGYYWNHGELDSLQRVIFADEILRQIPMLDPVALRQIMKEDKESLKKSAGKRTWGITMFVLWHLSFIAGQNLNELSS